MVSYWKLPFIVDLAIYSMVIFHSYVSLPEGIWKNCSFEQAKKDLGFPDVWKTMYLHLFGGCSGYASPVDPELWFVPTYYVTGSCTLKVVRFVRQLWENRHDFHGTSSYTFHVSHKKWWDYPSGNPRFLDTPKSDILGDVLQKYTLW